MDACECWSVHQHRRRVLLGWLLVLCSVCAFLAHSVHCSDDERPCSSPDSSDEHCVVHDSNPLRIGESVFRTAQVMHGLEAVDVCLVVSASSSMTSSHLWLQIAVPVLDGYLLTLGIGTGELKNRYCLVTFGGQGMTKFLRVSGQIFFPFHQFVYARRQLRRLGNSADGYEATEFTVLNAPFREHPNVAKIIILVTDTERTRPTSREDLTRGSILQMLYSHDIVMDTIVSVTLQLAEQRDGTVLGYHGYHKASILLPDGGYEMTHNESLLFTQAAGETISDYVALSLALGSSSWPLGLLNNEDYSTLLSFAKAFTNAHKLFPALPIEVCQKCLCGFNLEVSCDPPEDQEQCRCLMEQTPDECGVVQPTPSLPYVTSYLAPTSTPAACDRDHHTYLTPRTINPSCLGLALIDKLLPPPVAIEIEGHVNSLRGGDTIIFFSSNNRLATYQCVLMPNKIENPIITSCTSPYHISTPTPGQYSFLILAQHSGQRASLASLLLWFEVLTASESLEVTIIQRSILQNASVLVEFAANRLDTTFQCSTGDNPFHRCSSPYLIPPKSQGLREEVFIVLATDSNAEGAASVLKIEDPTISTPTTAAPGPVMIEVWAKLPTADGVLRICFRPTRNDVTCICTVDVQGPIICFNRTSGRGEYSASPDELGTGPHTLQVTCMDDDAYSTSEMVKFNLAEPPLAPPPTESLHCNLSLVGPNERGILLATHDCSRPVTSLCEVSRLPPVSCGRHFEFNTSPLGPGNHVFVLVAEDGFGESVMKVYPFFIETAQRKCCPQIVKNLTTVTVESDMLVHLHLGVDAGNCSLNEGFSYGINWGDAASESGTKTHLSNLYSSRQYSTPGEYSINAVYCNNPAANEDTCCATIVLPVDVDLPQQT